MSAITTHVLDTARGRPARGLAVRLDYEGATLGRSTTDVDGRVRDLLPPDRKPAPGLYRLVFETGDWFAATGVEAFYPQVSVDFRVRDGGEHHHVPLLLSPWGYSTYRGS